jgi:hypothetical protein
LGISISGPNVFQAGDGLSAYSNAAASRVISGRRPIAASAALDLIKPGAVAAAK